MVLELSRHAVMTGIGAVGYFGIGSEELWSFVLKATPAFVPCTRYEIDYLCGDVRDFNLLFGA